MLTLLLGTDWISNREEILQMIANDVDAGKGGRVLIVPDFISHEAERRLCMAAGDTASRYAEVLSFSRLAQRVADYVGHAAQPCMDNGGRVVAMAAAAKQLHSQLKAYASVETKPEFLTGLVDAVDEFKRCCITSSMLSEASAMTDGSLSQKLHELSLLLDTYDSLCSHGKRDPRDAMTILLEELNNCSFAKEHVFYIDGFPDFTRQHTQIVSHLIQHSANVTVSLNCDGIGSDALAFKKAGDTALELVRIAKQSGVSVEVRQIPSRDDALKPVRDCLLQGKTERIEHADALKAFRATSVYKECLVVAESIIEKVHNGARYRDISIVCSDSATYVDTMEMVLERCHIPVYMSGMDNILSRSVIKAILAAIETALNGFERQDVLDYMKSILSPVDLDVCDQLDNYATIWNVRGNGWLKEWTFHPDGLGAPWTDESSTLLNQLNNARELVVAPLEALTKAFHSAVNLHQQVQALFDFMESICLSQKLDALAAELDEYGDNREAQILNQLWEILLSALEQMNAVLGQTAWDSNAFIRLFKLLLSQYDVGTIPSVLDAVTFGPVSSMRCQQAQHLYVMGVEEGSMPGYSGTAGVLNDQERVALRNMGVPLTGGAIEGLENAFSEIYGVFCGAVRTITTSCSCGQPSFIYRRLAEMAGGDTQALGEFGAALSDEQEASAYLVRICGEDEAKALNIHESYLAMQRKKTHTLGKVNKENIDALYGNSLNLSASQIDKFAECKLSYFLKYGLRLNERKEATVDPSEFGTYVHWVLENTARTIMELGGFRKVSVDESLQISGRYSDEYIKERFSQLDSDRVGYLFRRNSSELSLIVRELWQELHVSKFEPVDFELGFGFGSDMPAIKVYGRDMHANLRGFVDRVDRCQDDEGNYFRVVDYKTGKKDMDYCDVFNGIGLQMLLYLFALEQEGEDILGEDPIPAGVQYFPARVPLVSADGILSDEEASAERGKLWKRKGLVLSEDAVLQAMESPEQPGRMPFSRKKDGSVSGDIASRKQLQLLKKYIFGLLEKMVNDISSGHIDANPYTRGSAHNACTYCPFGSICHLENIEERRNYKAMTAQKFWEDIGKEVAEHG